MATLTEQRKTLMNRALTLTEKIMAGDESLLGEAEATVAEIKALDEKIERARIGETMLAKIAGEPREYPNANFDSKAASQGVPTLAAKGLLPFSRGRKAYAGALRQEIAYGDTIGRKAVDAPGALTVDIPLMSIAELAQPATSLIDVIPTVTRSVTYRYKRQTARTPNAGWVAPGDTKPTSTVTTETIDDRLRVLATLSDAQSRYDLDDVENFERFLNAELIYALQVKLEDGIVNGTGTGEIPTGVLNTAGIQTLTADDADDPFATTRGALTRLETLGYQADYFALNPTDWESIELAADETGRYYLPGQGAPIDRAKRQLWGVPVVLSNALAAGTGLAWQNGALELATDGQLKVAWSENVGSQFTTNQVTFRAEGRFNLNVYTAPAIVKINLGTGTSPS